ncbi:uncharacterized protein [Anabrus simplex]|uniref:uncharacterized protein n=1 Tax=Anabrus simplex TaxID=316456 RepID=UPI0035A32B6A
MEQPQFIKCEPDWQSDSGESYNCELNEEAATDKLVEVKCEPPDKFLDSKIGNFAEEFIKEEHEFQDVKETDQNEACILGGSPPSCFHPSSTEIVEKEMGNSDVHHLKEINGPNHNECASCIVGPVAPLLPDEGLEVSDNACSTETLLEKPESGLFVTSAEKKCTHLFETVRKNIYCCKICDCRVYPCSMCDKYFINRSSMYRHQRKHSQDNWLCYAGGYMKKEIKEDIHKMVSVIISCFDEMKTMLENNSARKQTPRHEDNEVK